MHSLDRRSFLWAALATLSMVTRRLEAAGFEQKLGVQSYSFRRFTFEQALDMLTKLGLRSIEPYGAHLAPEATGDQADMARELLERFGVAPSAYGVVGFDADSDKSRNVFEFASRFGIGVLSADPAPESFDHLEVLCEEFEIEIAIHNHGKGHRYVGLDDLMSATRGRNRFIGVCLDTGHALRTGEVPHEMLRRLGDRVHGVHLKDWVAGGEERTLGDGDIDLEAVASALREISFSGPVSIEYELSPEAPLAGVATGLGRWLDVNGR